ncbi:MAG TPA: peptide deformylase [Pyrinomonadaceae bacterium]|jgi:peptide deformylase|nr:peptide deformylase [Pyrinomonadaceae bacterium]
MVSKAVDILLLGNPALRVVASPVELFDELTFRREREQLYATLLEFRKRNNFGRAISAPQISCGKRLIAMHLNGEGHFIVNPEITWASKEHFTMWDDCMSFPSLLVRLERNRSISVHFQDESGHHHDWNRLDIAMSELLQHEIDHLDGILAIDRAIDRDSIILRDTFAVMPELFRRLVDYEISASKGLNQAS